MSVHIVKLSVGSESVDGFIEWVNSRVAYNKERGLGDVYDHVTRMFPRRRTELLNGGSIYWVIKGVVLVRQVIVDLQKTTGADGIDRCALLMAPQVLQTEPQPRRAFQGWRYLDKNDAPRDLSAAQANQTPPALRAELAELGLL